MNLVSIKQLEQRKYLQLCMSGSDPPIYITIERNRYDPLMKTTVYEIEIGIQIDSESVCVNKFITRYSVLRKFHKKCKANSKDEDFPIFPPKRFVSNNDPKFISKRENDLKTYFEQITQVKNLNQINIIKCFFNL